MNYLYFTDLNKFDKYQDTEIKRELHPNFDPYYLPEKVVLQGKHYHLIQKVESGEEKHFYYFEYKVVDIEQYLNTENYIELNNK